MRIYKYSMGFRTPAVDQSYSSIYYNHDLSTNRHPDAYIYVNVGSRSEHQTLFQILARARRAGHSLAKPDPSIARGSGRKPILRFVPAAGILQSNQIAERAITTY